MPLSMLKKLPKKAASMWESVYAAAKPKYGQSRAAQIAWAAVKRKFKKVGEKWVAKYSVPNEFVTTHYVFDGSDESVTKDEDGSIYKDYILTSNSVDSHGTAFSDFALKRIVEQINEEGVNGRIDMHELYDSLKMSKDITPDDLEKILQSTDSGIKAIKAIYKNGKVIATLKMTPHAYKAARTFKGLSIEARMPKDSLTGGVYRQARLAGFSFVNNPANPDAIV